MLIKKIWIILIVIGIVLIIAGVAINPNFHDGQPGNGAITTTKFMQYTHYSNGVYETIIPSNMTTETTCMDMVMKGSAYGPAHPSFLVPVKDLPQINSTNVQKYAISKPTNNSNAGNAYFNNVPPGSYAFIESKNNSLGIIITPKVPNEVSGILTFT